MEDQESRILSDEEENSQEKTLVDATRRSSKGSKRKRIFPIKEAEGWTT